MSPFQSFPPGTSHVLSRNGMAFLPPFVRARLEYLAAVFEWGLEEEKTHFTSHEVRGKLSDGHYNAPEGAYVAPVNFWIASDDNCNRSLYIGGSSCWICPDSHYLFFDTIDPTLLPETPDPHVWWCIHYEEGIQVIKIIVCPSEEIAEHFPDGV